MKYQSKLDSLFQPMYYALKRSKEQNKIPFDIMIENPSGFNYAYTVYVDDDFENSYRLVERMVKSLLWIVGGNKVYVRGNKEIIKQLKKDYSVFGCRKFDVEFMENVYKKAFQVIEKEDFPKENRQNLNVGKHYNGCRIGFDAGGSDWKVSAVVDGEVIFSKEVVWFPKINIDVDYHYKNIVEAFQLAASKMPRVDGIGVSSAGIYIDNLTAVASLFMKVVDSQYSRVKTIYLDAAKELGENIPIEVCNDGDVTAIAGAISFDSNNILGIAMGTSEAGGYVNEKGGLNGWLTELSFVPCDLNSNGPKDEWSGDVGTGCNYFSQDAVIRLAKPAGIELDESLSPAEKLKVVQALMEKDDERAYQIYETIGIYMGYTIPFYAEFYKIKKLLLLGRVTSGKGGDLIVKMANEILAKEFSHLNVEIVTADEKFKRVGQSIAAASLPIVE